MAVKAVAKKKNRKETDILAILAERAKKIPKAEMAKMPKNGSTHYKTPHLLD
jgi:hypothetical protein